MLTDEERDAVATVRDFFLPRGCVMRSADLTPIVRAANVLAGIALRDHPADEGEPVTPEWLLATCLTVCRGIHAASWRKLPGCDGIAIFQAQRGDDDRDDRCLDVRVKVRGDVYAVLRALKIDLKGTI